MEYADLAGFVQSSLEAFTDGDESNRVSPDVALSPDYVGMRIFNRPLVGFSDPHDSLFAQLIEPQVVGPQMRMPHEWLDGAQTVISYFFPMSEQVRVSNQRPDRPSDEWLHARIDGQAFILNAGRHLVALLEELGYRAVCPSAHKEFSATFYDEKNPALSFRSNWSERHVAYVCGLGTFSLTKAIITEAGMAGRFGSVVTTAPIPTTARSYDDLYEYCIMCGACIARCPVNAISFETGKDHFACFGELMASKRFHPGYLGCGKCQVNVPCEYQRPRA